jgi:hypothetical protein
MVCHVHGWPASAWRAFSRSSLPDGVQSIAADNSNTDGNSFIAVDCRTGGQASRYGRVRAVPETDLARIQRWVQARNDRLPAHAVGQIRFELDIDDRAVTILECRPPWSAGFGPEWTRSPVARLRYTKVRRQWEILWRDRNLRFHTYDLITPTPNVDTLLAHIDQDPTCIFWG